MPEIDHPEIESEPAQETAQPLSSHQVEKLRSGDTTIEPTYAEKRQRFIEQATASLERQAARALREAEVTEQQPHKPKDAIELHVRKRRDEAATLREEAARVAEEAAAQFDAENPA